MVSVVVVPLVGCNEKNMEVWVDVRLLPTSKTVGDILDQLHAYSLDELCRFGRQSMILRTGWTWRDARGLEEVEMRRSRHEER